MGTDHKRMKERQRYYRSQSKATDTRSRRKQMFYDTQFEAAQRELEAMVAIKPRVGSHRRHERGDDDES
jgi:hypothetical protein